tara:strand:+ start:148 stop:1026 length:879 start_codon:yes stop_codon:yes gene_type:complete
MDSENKGHGRLQAWGNVLTIGQKDPKRGFPTNTDKFFIKRPQPVIKRLGGRSVLMRENDPEFQGYNLSEKPELRHIIRISICHYVHLRNGWESMTDAFHWQLAAQQLPGHQQHPSKVPTCSGNGQKATRFIDGQFKDLPCPNRECKFRSGTPAPCKPIARLAFKLRWQPDKPWSHLPESLTKFETKSWYNLDKVLIPFFKSLHSQAISLGFKTYSFYGLPLSIRLSKRTSQRGSAVPAISIALDLPNGQNLQQFFLEQIKTQQIISSIIQPNLSNEPITPEHHDEEQEQAQQ